MIPLLLAGRLFVLVVTGLGGEPQYSERFIREARRFMTALEERYGVDRQRLTWLAEDPPRGGSMASGRSTSDNVLAALERLRTGTADGDRILVLLLGHGSQAEQPRFNLPGPDLEAGDLAAALSGFAGRTVVVVNAASASGGFADALAGPGRVIITATRTGLERNETMFGDAFVAAFTGEDADADRDGMLSLLEAYQYAQREVVRRYESADRLLTEHSRLSDEALARQVLFERPPAVAVRPGDSVAVALAAEKRDLERQVAMLRARRDTMDPAAYERQLEDLLLRLARVNRSLRERQERTP
ncbi:MAG TPA: hypothetical protein VLL51_03675 [Gemmatimonadales bacterium]|nr:hypothetical protein [Gemmatimonadales bacterium]